MRANASLADIVETKDKSKSGNREILTETENNTINTITS